MVFFLEYIEDELRPIERRLAYKFYVEKKDRHVIMKEIRRKKTAYYDMKKKIHEKVQEYYKKTEQN